MRALTINETLNFERGGDPIGKMRIGMVIKLTNLLNSFIETEMFGGNNRFYSFYYSFPNYLVFYAALGKKEIDKILKEWGFDQFLFWPGEIEEKSGGALFVKYKIKNEFINFLKRFSSYDLRTGRWKPPLDI
jgi:hypothetical protein